MSCIYILQNWYTEGNVQGNVQAIPTSGDFPDGILFHPIFRILQLKKNESSATGFHLFRSKPQSFFGSSCCCRGGVSVGYSFLVVRVGSGGDGACL